jgi:hypothetical protein
VFGRTRLSLDSENTGLAMAVSEVLKRSYNRAAMCGVSAISAWEKLGRIKLIPAILAGVVSTFLPFRLPFRVLLGTALYVALYCITWRRANGSRFFPPYLW